MLTSKKTLIRECRVSPCVSKMMRRVTALRLAVSSGLGDHAVDLQNRSRDGSFERHSARQLVRTTNRGAPYRISRLMVASVLAQPVLLRTRLKTMMILSRESMTTVATIQATRDGPAGLHLASPL